MPHRPALGRPQPAGLRQQRRQQWLRRRGSYAGQGGVANGGTPNVTYGDLQSPNEAGSGGATHAYNTASGGGGLIRLTAGTLTLNGTIRANGQPQTVGAGSGGGVYVNAGTFAGSGSIEAKGGTSTGPNGGNGGGGGGGRIAVVAATNTFSGTLLATPAPATSPAALAPSLPAPMPVAIRA